MHARKHYKVFFDTAKGERNCYIALMLDSLFFGLRVFFGEKFIHSQIEGENKYSKIGNLNLKMCAGARAN